MDRHVSKTVRCVATRIFILVIASLATVISDAYEVSTHAALTREAYLRSWLNPAMSDLFMRLGIDVLSPDLGVRYVDLTPDATVFREASPQFPPGFAETKIRDANRLSESKPELPSLSAWLMLGAIREDDVPYDAGAIENTPQDELGGPFVRVFNHFFDPYLDRPLVVGVPSGARAPDWALVTPSTGTANHFTVAAARESMWRALTLKRIAGSALIDAYATSDFASDVWGVEERYREELRKTYWATTFRALGDVVHLLQDMAQPQHTRNDPHSGRYCAFVICPGGHASYFEHYVDARAIGAPGFTLRERFFENDSPSDISEAIAAAPLDYGNYPIPRFNGYRDYFVTALGAASASGLGLANYSNQGFYSSGTNIYSGADEYASPSPVGAGLEHVVQTNVNNARNQPVRGVLTLYQGPVLDRAFPDRSEQSVLLSSRGAFDQFLAQGPRRFTLNHYNYDDQARLLIPRAVAYSAGLLDYFFRGSMEITVPDEGVYSVIDDSRFAPPAPEVSVGFKGFDTLRLKLRNTTNPTTPPSADVSNQPMSNGIIVAIVKFHRNGCYTNNLDGEITEAEQAAGCRSNYEEIVVSDPILSAAVPFGDQGHPHGIDFSFHFAKEVPINAWDVVLQVAYRGQLGGEADAVVVSTKDISEPTFITTFNDTDYIFLDGTCYAPSVVAGSDALWNRLGPACRDGSGSKRSISPSCVDVPLNLRFNGGSGEHEWTFATDMEASSDKRLPARHFSRFAVLADRSPALSMGFAFNNPPLYLPNGNTSIATLPAYVVQNTIASRYSTHRGIKVWDALMFIVDGATGAVGAGCPEEQFDALGDANRFPVPAYLSGWGETP
jgi:hypothetical protein